MGTRGTCIYLVKVANLINVLAFFSACPAYIMYCSWANWSWEWIVKFILGVYAPNFGELLHFLHMNARNSFSQDTLHINIAACFFGCILSLCMYKVYYWFFVWMITMCCSLWTENSWGPGQIINVGPLDVTEISRQS